jgi:hypothetical protein
VSVKDTNTSDAKAAREAHAKAQREAEKLEKQQEREAAKAFKRNAANKELIRRCADFGIIMPEGIELDENGNVVDTLDNCYRILQSQPWGFAYDELAQTHRFLGTVLWPDHYGTELNDALALAIRLQIIAVFEAEFSTQHVTDSLTALCRAAP